MKHALTAAILLADGRHRGASRRTSGRAISAAAKLNKQFTDADAIFYNETTVSVAITSDDIAEIERGLVLLRQCKRFWECVNLR